MSTLRCRGILLALLALAGSSGQGYAQVDPAVLIVQVRSEEGAPLAGARVEIGRAGATTTDAHGTARLDGLPAGPTVVFVGRVGYASALRVLQLEGGRTFTAAFTLRPQPITLPKLIVRAKPRSRYLKQVGFEQRRARGFGSFVTRADIEQQNPMRLSEVLRRLPGVSVLPGAFRDDAVQMSRAGGRRCPIQYFVDGIPVSGYNADDMPARDVEGMEVYRGASEVPVEFNSRAGTSNCGVIVIWTRIR